MPTLPTTERTEQTKSPVEPLHSLMDLEVPVAGKSLLPKIPIQKKKLPQERKPDLEIPQNPIFVKAMPAISTNKNPLPNIGNSRDNLWTAAKPVPKHVENNEEQTDKNKYIQKHDVILEKIRNIAIQIGEILKTFVSGEQVFDFKNSLFNESSDLKTAIRETYSLDKNILDQIRPTIKEYLDYIDSEISETYNKFERFEEETVETNIKTQSNQVKPTDTNKDSEEASSLTDLNPGQWFALYEGRILCFASDKEDLRERLNHYVLNENMSLDSVKAFKCINVDFGILIEE